MVVSRGIWSGGCLIEPYIRCLRWASRVLYTSLKDPRKLLRKLPGAENQLNNLMAGEAEQRTLEMENKANTYKSCARDKKLN